jgi:hypothetical protein
MRGFKVAPPFLQSHASTRCAREMLRPARSVPKLLDFLLLQHAKRFAREICPEPAPPVLMAVSLPVPPGPRGGAGTGERGSIKSRHTFAKAIPSTHSRVPAHGAGRTTPSGRFAQHRKRAVMSLSGALDPLRALDGSGAGS